MNPLNALVNLLPSAVRRWVYLAIAVALFGYFVSEVVRGRMSVDDLFTKLGLSGVLAMAGANTTTTRPPAAD